VGELVASDAAANEEKPLDIFQIPEPKDSKEPALIT